MTRTNGPWTHTSDDSYMYQLSLVVAIASISLFSEVSTFVGARGDNIFSFLGWVFVPLIYIFHDGEFLLPLFFLLFLLCYGGRSFSPNKLKFQGTPRENSRRGGRSHGGPGTGGNYRHILALLGTAKIGSAKI